MTGHRSVDARLSLVRVAVYLTLAVVAFAVVTRDGARRPFAVETVATGLDTPWALVWGPDGRIWMTERAGRVSRLDPETGAVEVLGEVPDVLERGEGGLMGLALHPDFPDAPWVYLAHSYRGAAGVENRLVRMRWTGTPGDALSGYEVLLSGIPGRGNHNGSRLAFGPDGFLYMTTGDAGDPDLAQDMSSLGGKVLRLTDEGAPAPGNPFGDAVWSYGHRNAQGLVFHPRTGRLYASEHGPRDNDEVNVIVEGGDYGWPAVHGTCDGDTRGEEAYCRDHDVQEAIHTWTPTVGVAGIDLYLHDRLPGWRGSLLVTSLRGQALFRLSLSANGLAVTGSEALYRGAYGRLRDVLVGPDGTVYLTTSNRDGRGRPDEADDRILRIVP